MARVFTLSSGSSGNSAYVGDAQSGILVDIGISFLKMKTSLEEAGMSIDCVEALLITHEHSDHIKGLSTFCKKTDIPVYASQKTSEYLLEHIPECEKNLHIIETDKTYKLNRTSFSAFSVYHDAQDALGYRITTADNREVVYCTDIGHMDEKVLSHIQRADLNIIEANYDENMLMCNSAYPFLLKRRISGECGHLSNEQCAQTVTELYRRGCRRFLLAHLSEQNNLPEVALETVKLALLQMKLKEGIDFELEVAPRFDMSRMLIF